MSKQRLREFKMPDVGEGLTEAEIVRWLVAPADRVRDGMPVCEVETAKATVELPIPFDGVVHELRFAEGSTVDVGAVIITVDAAPGVGPAARDAVARDAERAVESPAPGGEAAAEPDTRPGTSGARQPVLVGYGVSESTVRRRPRKRTSGGPAGPAGPVVPAGPAGPAGTAGTAGGPRVAAKPPVRKLARDLGVDLTAIMPTGPDGVVTRDDVHAAARPTDTPAPAPGGGRVTPGETRIPVKGVRKATARAMVASAFTAPHVTEFLTVDVTRTTKLVRGLREEPDFAGVRVTPLLLVAKAYLTAIGRHPQINASWDEAGQEIVVKDAVNLGIAAATPRGLIVPHIKAAQHLSLRELAVALQELVETARAGRTPPGDLTGGTTTITNIGVFGVDTGTPILNPGEAAILAAGAIRTRPWVHKGKVRPRQVMNLALSFDHRLVDGELGSRVLATTASVLEQPTRLIGWS